MSAALSLLGLMIIVGGVCAVVGGGNVLLGALRITAVAFVTFMGLLVLAAVLLQLH